MHVVKSPPPVHGEGGSLSGHDLQLDGAHCTTAPFGHEVVEEGSPDMAAARLGNDVEFFDPQGVAAFFDADDLVGEEDTDRYVVQLG